MRLWLFRNGLLSKFYEGRLTDAPSTKEDNVYPKAMRVFSQQAGFTEGSEYFIVDCVGAISQAKENQTSLLNTAFATVTVECVQNLLLQGVLAKLMVVLTYYSGQMLLTHHALDEVAYLDAEMVNDADQVAVKTVDSYQGAETSIVIVDTTVGAFSH